MDGFTRSRCAPEYNRFVPEFPLTRRTFVGAISAMGCLAAGGASNPRNFELQVEARPRRGSAAGVRFHKKFEIRVGTFARLRSRL